MPCVLLPYRAADAERTLSNYIFARFDSIPGVKECSSYYIERWKSASPRSKITCACIFGAIECMLCGNLSYDAFAKVVSDIMQPVHEWFFDKQVHRRSNTNMELIWGALKIAWASCWLRRSRKTKQAHIAGSLLDPVFRDLFWCPDRLNEKGGSAFRCIVARRFLVLQSTALFRENVILNDSMAVVYSWVGDGLAYLGYAIRTRKTQVAHAGPVYRWLEHEVTCAQVQKNRVPASVRPAARGSKLQHAKRLACFRKGFLVLMAGASEIMSAAEQAAIKSLRPASNGFGNAPRAGLQVKNRRRPPKSARLQHDRGQPPRGLFSRTHWPPEPNRSPLKSLLSWADKPTFASSKILRGHWFWTLSYSEMWKMVMRLRGGVTGPIDIYVPPLWPVLIGWLGTKSKDYKPINWDRLEELWEVRCGPLAVLPGLSLLQGPVRQRIASFRLNHALAERNLPPLKGVRLKVDFGCMVPALRSGLRLALQRTNRPDVEEDWIWKRTNIVVGRSPTFEDSCAKSGFAKELQVGELLSWSSRKLRKAVQGIGASMVQQRWDVSVRPDGHDLGAAVSKICFFWVSRWLGQHAFRSTLSMRGWNSQTCAEHPAICNQLSLWRATRKEYRRYTKAFATSSSEVVVPDDKRKHVCWIVPYRVHIANLFIFVINSPYWKLCPLTLPAANKRLCDILAGGIPASLRKWLRIDDAVWRLPVMYNSIKGKCHDVRGGGRTCEKVSHSCCRKIVAFTEWPKKQNWRLLCRGVETVLKKYGGGAETWRLKDAVPDLTAKVCNLRSSFRLGLSRTQCCRCGALKPPWTGTVADAGQFFEAVDAPQVEHDLNAVFARASAESGLDTVTVFRTRARRGFVGGSIGLWGPRAYTFKFEQLSRCIGATAKINFVSVGDAVAQTTGLPIGGCTSKVMCSTVLCESEHNWGVESDRRRSLGFAPQNIPWSSLVAATRYVDDCIVVSPFFLQGLSGRKF